jgi:hypothetical protein
VVTRKEKGGRKVEGDEKCMYPYPYPYPRESVESVWSYNKK